MKAESSQSDKALIVTREVGGHPFGQREADGYFNATAMCQGAGKLFGHYRANKSTSEFLEALALDIGIPISKLTDEFRGRPAHHQGTWVHPRVAIHLAAWLSLEFETLVTGWVADWWRQQGEYQGALREWISPDLRPWVLTFPPSFYAEIYRLKGWPGPIGHQRPSVIGHYTNDIVYARLTPGLLETLRIKNPKQITGERKDRHHQWLTDHRGYPKLHEHLGKVLMLMGGADDWDQFMREIDRYLPVFTDQLSLFESQKREKEMTLWE